MKFYSKGDSLSNLLFLKKIVLWLSSSDFAVSLSVITHRSSCPGSPPQCVHFRCSRTTSLKQCQGSAQRLAHSRRSPSIHFLCMIECQFPSWHFWPHHPLSQNLQWDFSSGLNYASYISNLSGISPLLYLLLFIYCSLIASVNVSSLALLYLLILIPHIVLNITPSTL